MMDDILQTKHLGISFGGLDAVKEFNIEIGRNDLVGLIGPNGAGKTTAFNLITGVYEPTAGDILFDGKSIKGKKVNQINNLGISRTFQNIRLFKDLSVIENLKVAMNQSMKYSILSGVLRLKDCRREEEFIHEKAISLLKEFDLHDLSETIATNLPYGKQRKLEIARALASDPKLLLLDEPAAGMNPNETQELMETIRIIHDKFKVAILLIEHDMHFVMGICEKIYVLDYGEIIAQGLPKEIVENKKVISAYLGE